MWRTFAQACVAGTVPRVRSVDRLLPASTSLLSDAVRLFYRTGVIGAMALILLWTWQLQVTWATWGSLTIDSGREMYVPAALNTGDVLYRDVWYLYGPLSPYFNSGLFRLFGTQLEVLYWAGALAALGSALALFMAGQRLARPLIGWTAAAVVVLQSFGASIFSFPLPYSFASVYGALTASVFAWALVSLDRADSRRAMFAVATLPAVALLLKLEFGVAAYATFGAWMFARALQHRSLRAIVTPLMMAVPGALVCLATVGWMVSLRGVSFITQENIMSWPTSYFMTHHGKAWLEVTGFTLDAAKIVGAIVRTIFPFGAAVTLYAFFRWPRRDVAAWTARLASIAGLIACSGLIYFFHPHLTTQALVLPRDMVVYLVAGTAIGWWRFWRRRGDRPGVAIPLLLTFAALLSLRVALKMSTTGYPIYYNGPAILAYLLLAGAVVRRVGGRRGPAIECVLCGVCLASVAITSGHFLPRTDLVPLTTARGTIRVPDELARGYRAALAFMRQSAARGEPVLSVPEDTSLYFLSGTACPVRVCTFVPGVIAPGAMEQATIEQIASSRVRYLLWSNRTFPEYKAPVFGTDFNVALGDYLKRHYRRVSQPHRGRWSVDIWERLPTAVAQ